MEEMANPAPTLMSVKISVNYAGYVLRQFRENVLKLFFEEYPQAASVKNWRDIAIMVAWYTTRNGVWWYPNRAAVIDALQKQTLLAGKRVKEAHVNYETHRLVWKRGQKWYSKKVKQIVPQEKIDPAEKEVYDKEWPTLLAA